MRRASFLVFSSLWGFLAVACASPTDDTARDEAPIIGGAETNVRPEIGMVDFNWGEYCTATLIAPRVAITAGHCVRYATRDATSNFGNFRIDSPNGQSHWYDVDRYRSFLHDGLGAPDVALIRLADAVPANVATPAAIASSKPSNGAALTIFGYGCNDNWDDQTGGGVKRNFHTAWGDRLENTLCPGDSGGPVTIDATGQVLLVNSGWKSGFLDPRHDVFGEVPQYFGKIQQQIAAWNGAEPAHGLTGTYYDTKDIPPAEGDAKVTRVDATVNFDFGDGSPDAIIENDSFAAEWTGSITAPTSETYTLEVYSDDGARLDVDGQSIVDAWTDHSPASSAGTIALQAGHPVAIDLAITRTAAAATVKLFWSSPSTPRQIVPSSALTPN